MKINKCILTNNDCYKSAMKINPVGIIVHSTGCNNPTLRRYIQPNDGFIGDNKYNNHWNKSGLDVCVHAFIGKDINGEVKLYQTLPFNYACWGCGAGSKGSYNYNPPYIQFEICEDDLTNSAYYDECFRIAVEFCAYLCNRYHINVSNVIDHAEAHLRGYASNHGDVKHWQSNFNDNMLLFRARVNYLTYFSLPIGGKIKLLYNRKLYEQPNIKANVVNISDLNVNYKKHVKPNKNNYAILSKGTKITVKDRYSDNKGNVWVKCAYGWVATIYNSKRYCE